MPLKGYKAKVLGKYPGTKSCMFIDLTWYIRTSEDKELTFGNKTANEAWKNAWMNIRAREVVRASHGNTKRKRA